MISAATLKSLTTQHQKLTEEWKKKDLNACSATLDALKVAMTEMTFLPTDDTLDLQAHKQELMLARDVLEIGAHHAIAVKNPERFERYVAQLKAYYQDYRRLLPESAYQFELMGLNLMCLLSKNNFAGFHTELELLPPDSSQNNPYIRCPVRMEQFIMEGSYNKVLMMKDNVPSESYSFFMNKLLFTIRDDIASCMEKAYEHISVKDCGRLLQLDAKATEKYVADKKWNVGKDNVIRFEHVTKDEKNNEEVPTEELAKMSITYAREMEQIV